MDRDNRSLGESITWQLQLLALSFGYRFVYSAYDQRMVSAKIVN